MTLDDRAADCAFLSWLVSLARACTWKTKWKTKSFWKTKRFRFAPWNWRAEAMALISIRFALWIGPRPDGCYSLG
jgi:hypothetical protein